MVSPASPVVNQKVRFIGVTAGLNTSWSWSFGDGATSALENPTHTYSTAGTFTVTLTVSNAGGSNSVSKGLTVRVLPPLAGFSFSPTSPTTGQTMSFTDNSTNTPTSWSWAFGDGTTSVLPNPAHTYSRIRNRSTYGTLIPSHSH